MQVNQDRIDKNKLLVFIQNGVGGAERMTLNIAKLLPIQEWDVTICKICSPYIVQNGRIEDFIPREFKIMTISWTSQLGLLRQLKNTIKIVSPCVVFSSLMSINLRLLLLNIFFKNIRFIVRNDNYLFTLNKIKKLFLQITYKKATYVIAQTEEMKEELVNIGLSPKKVKILHNFIDIKGIEQKSLASSPFNSDELIRYVSVGRIAKQKGFDILIKAYYIVFKQNPKSKLYIIGHYDNKDPYYLSLIKMVCEYGLESNVIFVGYTDNPYVYIKYSNVYVLSSRYEGLPNSLIESQFLKTPAAATTCIPIISRMIIDGKNGYLAEPESADSLAEAMIRCTSIKDVIPVYTPSSKEDFISLFRNSGG